MWVREGQGGILRCWWRIEGSGGMVEVGGDHWKVVGGGDSWAHPCSHAYFPVIHNTNITGISIVDRRIIIAKMLPT